MNTSSEKIIHYLHKHRIVSPDVLDNIKKNHELEEDQLFENLLSKGMLSLDQIVQAKSAIHQIPFVDLNRVEANIETLALLPNDIALKNQIVLLRKEEHDAWIGASDILSSSVIKHLKQHLQCKIHTTLVSPPLLNDWIKRYYECKTLSNSTEITTLDSSHSTKSMVSLNISKPSEIQNLVKNPSDDTSIIQLAELIVAQAIEFRSSDIHLEPSEDGIRIRYRIDGVLHTAMHIPKSFTAPLTSRFKIMSDMNIAEKRLPQDGRIEIVIQGKSWDLRTSTVPTSFGEKMVMRILDKTSVMIGMENLGFTESNEEIIKKLSAQPNGMILCTGPTGSGKTTTQYALLHHLNRPSVNILTIEDPVEYQLAGITQVQVNRKAGLSFASALRSFLRQDPDIIMIGEMRDLETTQIAVESALTGHLVLSTLHTNDAPSAIMRLVDMGIEPYLISATVIGVLAQRLARKLCSNCKEPWNIKESDLEKWNLPIVNPNKEHTIYTPKGCERCRGTGYTGRVGLHELMVMNGELAELIVSRTPTHELKQEAVTHGMKQLKEDGLAKILQGYVDPDEVVRVVSTIGY